MIPRTAASTLVDLSQYYPVVAVTGPRQSGKTTLVRNVFADKPYVSLEEPDQLEFANQDPKGFLARYPDGAVLDEAQRCPSLFSYIQTIVDSRNRQGFFVLTGSQQFGLLSKITQTLAGRVGLLQLLPFSIDELRDRKHTFHTLDEVLFKGLYPPIYDRKIHPANWYANYILTYVERDVRQILNVKDLNTFQRFIRMCAARTGQLLNLASIGNDCGITHNTAKMWISVLEASYIVFLLYPHYKNFGKRLVKTPKIYFYDTGLAVWLLNIKDIDHLSIHPMRGALFESLIISELQKSRFNRGLTTNIFFWRNNLGDEIDVIIEDGDILIPLEVKSGQTITQDAFKGLRKWENISGSSKGASYLVYGGDEKQVRLNMNVLPWKNIHELKI